MKRLSVIVITLLVAIPATWMGARWYYSKHHAHAHDASTAPGERKVLYYQSAMHPWIKSDKPGRCTICGMELTPVYEGEAGFGQTGGEDIVPLTQNMIQVLNVQTAEAKVQPLKKTLIVAGTIDDNATRHRVLSAYIPGRIEKLHVNFMGAEVKEGQPLAEFYSPALLQAEREYRAGSAELRATTALRLRQMGLTPAQIEALPAKPADVLTSQILSPIGGTVVAQEVFEGQYVEEGAKLFEIADFETMWFQFNAYEQDLPWLKPDLNVDVTTPAHPGRTFHGKITFIDPNFDGATRATKVRVELDNPKVEGRRLLLHRLYAEGTVSLDAPEVLAVPRTAVIETGPQAVAYVDKSGGAYERRPLKVGRRGDTLIEVMAGLSAGDKVVVNGNLLIDSQAEMNRVFAPPAAAHEHTSTSGELPKLTAPQRKAIQDLLVLAEALGAALAADNLNEFNTQAARTHSSIPALLKAFEDAHAWRGMLKPFETAGHLTNAKDLTEARRIFHPFSVATVALAHTVRRADAAFGSVKIFRCPMTQTAFPGAPRQSDWVQLKEPLRNPYFGADMLDCGSELKP